MFTVTALLIPFMVCFTWAITVSLQTDKNDVQKHLAWLLAIAAVYFFIDASYLVPNGSHSDYVNLVYLDIVSQYITVIMFPVMMILMTALTNKKKIPAWVIFLSILPGLLLGTTAAGLYFGMGIQNAADYIAATDISSGRPAGYEAPIYLMHELICQKIYNIILLIEIIFVFAYAIRIMVKSEINIKKLSGFFKNGTSLNQINSICFLFLALLVICAVRIALGRQYLLDHLFVSGFLSFLLGAVCFLIAYVSNWFSDRDFNLWDFRHPSLIRENSAAVEILKPESEPAAREITIPDTAARTESAPETVPAPTASMREDKAQTRLEQFLSYMDEQHPFLNPDLSIADVSEALHSNRTYVSILVNENFQMTFRDYINKRRIEFSKVIMLENPDEILEEIAEKSGFLSDSQFSKKFKEIEGMSPRTWLQKQLM